MRGNIPWIASFLRTMKIIGAAVCGIGMTGCAVTEHYYLPHDHALAKQGTVCGSVPYGYAFIPLAEELSLALMLAPREGHIVLRLQLPIPTGTSVRFTEPALRLRVSSGAEDAVVLGNWRPPVAGPSLAGDDVLNGLGRTAALATRESPYLGKDLYISTAQSSLPPDRNLVVTLPPLEINGTKVPARAIDFDLVEMSGLKSCVQ